MIRRLFSHQFRYSTNAAVATFGAESQPALPHVISGHDRVDFVEKNGVFYNDELQYAWIAGKGLIRLPKNCQVDREKLTKSWNYQFGEGILSKYADDSSMGKSITYYKQLRDNVLGSRYDGKWLVCDAAKQKWETFECELDAHEYSAEQGFNWSFMNCLFREYIKIGIIRKPSSSSSTSTFKTSTPKASLFEPSLEDLVSSGCIPGTAVTVPTNLYDDICALWGNFQIGKEYNFVHRALQIDPGSTHCTLSDVEYFNVTIANKAKGKIQIAVTTHHGGTFNAVEELLDVRIGDKILMDVQTMVYEENDDNKDDPFLFGMSAYMRCDSSYSTSQTPNATFEPVCGKIGAFAEKTN